MPLDCILSAIAAWLLIGMAGVLALRRLALVAHLLFPLGGLAALLLAAGAAWALASPPQALTNDAMEAWLTEAGTGLRRGAVLLGQRIAGQIGGRRDEP